MTSFASARVAVLLVALFACQAAADMYLHSPPGCNDRNRERNDNRQNGNRLFDSQNNGAGGYAWRGDPTTNGKPDPLVYYSGSMLRLEWTNQHACGPNKNVHCDLVIQYACNDTMTGLRDGYPTGEIATSDNNNPDYKLRKFKAVTITPANGDNNKQNQQGTNRIPQAAYSDKSETIQNEFYFEGKHGGVEFGMHESHLWYKKCKLTSRNLGLYTSDQKVGTAAINTRQNPNGGRRGLECPEERDYYPYWRPAPFKDIAVLTSDVQYCEYYQENSQNVQSRWECVCDDTCRNSKKNKRIPINQAECEGGTNPGQWVERPAWGLDKPDCRLHSFGRDNHLGNTLQVDEDGTPLAGRQPETAHYNLKVPADMENKLCILRLRYNISTGDYPSHQFAEARGTRGVGFDSNHNCPKVVLQNTDDENAGTTAFVESNPQCSGKLMVDSKPLFNRPYVRLFDSETPKLGLAINTHQTGRTFQDRTYVFEVTERPQSVPKSRTIWNLNMRGRRGNIVQCYPAVEYDFVPSILEVTQGDFIHMQIHGSDFNAAKNANNGEGWQYSDRTNIVQMEKLSDNYPLHMDKMTLFNNVELAKRWALLEQQGCDDTFKDGSNKEQNAIRNCGKLNSAPNRYPKHASDGLMNVDQDDGEYYIMSTRNNNFSNRSQKSIIVVGKAGLSAGTIVAIAFGVAVGAAGMAAAAVLYFKKRNGRLGGKGGEGSSVPYRQTKSPASVPASSSTAAAPATTSGPVLDYQRYN